MAFKIYGKIGPDGHDTDDTASYLRSRMEKLLQEFKEVSNEIADEYKERGGKGKETEVPPRGQKEEILTPKGEKEEKEEKRVWGRRRGEG